MPFDPSQVKAFMELGANCILFFCMALAIRTLFQMVQDKDKQIISEREKREDLIKESIQASTTMLETTERILDSLHRIENGVLLNVRDK